MAENEYFIIFGGGGIRGLSYCGAYKAIEEQKINVSGCAGSSIGAVFAALLAIGYNYNEIFEILSDVSFDMFIDINIDFKKELAISKGKIFLDWIKEKIEKKFYGNNYKKGQMPPVTFEDLKSKLIIYSVDLVKLEFCEFSNEKTPDFEIAKAVRASVSMPGLFTPLEYNDKLLVDGDLLKSMPLWRVSETIKNTKERVLEFRLEDNETPKKINNSIEYLNRVYNAISGFATDYIVDLYKEKDKFDYIKINTSDISVVDFFIPKDKKEELFKTGYNKTKEYFVQYYPEKRKKLLKKYETLISHVIKFQKEFNKSNIINSYLHLCEIFMYLCEEKRFIDTSIFCNLSDFKTQFMNNYKCVNFFCFKSAEINNKEYLSKALLEIIKDITVKIRELAN